MLRKSPSKVKLGKTQVGVLTVLVERKRWFNGCGWIWSGQFRTEQVLESLVARGLAIKAIEPVLMHGRTAMVWTPTEAGVAQVRVWTAERDAQRAAAKKQTLVIDLKYDK